MGAWVPLQDHPWWDDAYFYGASSGYVLESGGIVRPADSDAPREGWGLGSCDNSPAPALRVTVIEYATQSGSPGDQYMPARFDYFPSNLVEIKVYNTAPPFAPGDGPMYLDSGSPITSFLPAQFETQDGGTTDNDCGWLRFVGAQTTSGYVAFDAAVRFQIEAWAEDEEPPGEAACFWTEVLNAEQICDGEVPVDPVDNELDFTSSDYGLGGSGGTIIRSENWNAPGTNLIEAALDSWEVAGGGSMRGMVIDKMYDPETMAVLYDGTYTPPLELKYEATGYGPAENSADYRVLWLNLYDNEVWGDTGLDVGEYVVDATFYDAALDSLGTARGYITVSGDI